MKCPTCIPRSKVEERVQPDIFTPAANMTNSMKDSLLLEHLRNRVPRGIHIIEDGDLLVFNRHLIDFKDQSQRLVSGSVGRLSTDQLTRVRQIKNFDSKYNGKEVFLDISYKIS